MDQSDLILNGLFMTVISSLGGMVINEFWHKFQHNRDWLTLMIAYSHDFLSSANHKWKKSDKCVGCSFPTL